MMRTNRWMTDMASILRDRPITQLTLPGAHDSATGNGCMYGPDAFCQTQKLQFLDLLNAGVRYLDVRFADKFVPCEFSTQCTYVTSDSEVCAPCPPAIPGGVWPSTVTDTYSILGYHGPFNTYESMGNLCSDLRGFFAVNPNEIVILRMEVNPSVPAPGEYAVSAAEALLATFAKCAGDLLVDLPALMPRKPTYGDILRAGPGRVLCFYHMAVAKAETHSLERDDRVHLRGTPMSISLHSDWTQAEIMQLHQRVQEHLTRPPTRMLPTETPTVTWFWDAAYQGRPNHDSPESVYDFLAKNYSTKDLTKSPAIAVMQAITMWTIPTFWSIMQNSAVINEQFNATYLARLSPPVGRTRHNIIMIDTVEQGSAYVKRIIDLNKT